MIKRFFVFLLLFGLLSIFANLLFSYMMGSESSLNLTAQYYAEHTAKDIGAANIVTAIIVTYRGLDTLGEVTVLFLTASIIGLVLAKDTRKKLSPEPPSKQQADPQTEQPALHSTGELLSIGSNLLVPLILLLGAYVFINGHLTPGGGFQGGAIIASASLLLLLTDPLRHFSHTLISRVESTSGLFFIGLGLLGIAFAGGFLDNRILPTGTLGSIFSAGIIPIIYSFVGLKVGAEFTSMMINLAETKYPEQALEQQTDKQARSQVAEQAGKQTVEKNK